jgi:hypothetical protein
MTPWWRWLCEMYLIMPLWVDEWRKFGKSFSHHFFFIKVTSRKFGPSSNILSFPKSMGLTDVGTAVLWFQKKEPEDDSQLQPDRSSPHLASTSGIISLAAGMCVLHKG